MQTLSLEEAAKLLTVSPRSLADKRYRFRIGLPCRKVGRRVLFVESDVIRLLENGREHMPSLR